MNDERREELASLYALDLLEGEERSAFETELQRDPELRTLVDELRETSAQLALTAPAAAPSPFLRERVLASVAAQRGVSTPAPSSRSATPPMRPNRGNGTWMAWGVAAGFAVLAGFFGLQWQTVQRDLRAREAAEADRVAAATREVEELRAQWQRDRATASEVITELRRQADVAELKVASLASLLRDSPEAQAIAVWNPLQQEGVLTVVNLPALEAGKDYQLWLVDPQYDIPVDGGVFRVDPATGEARVQFKPKQPVSTVQAFAVSLEREGGVPKAEGPMVLISE